MRRNSQPTAHGRLQAKKFVGGKLRKLRLIPEFDDVRGAPERRRKRARRIISVRLLPNAEGREDPVQNIVSGSRARHRIDGSKSRIEIQQQHLMRQSELHSAVAIFER